VQVAAVVPVQAEQMKAEVLLVPKHAVAVLLDKKYPGAARVQAVAAVPVHVRQPAAQATGTPAAGAVTAVVAAEVAPKK